jgi:hypothetical protein
MQKFQGTNEQYRDYTEIELWREYGRRKREWQQQNPGASCEEYDRMIDQLCRELGV